MEPGGRWIAFLSDRALPGEAPGADGEPESEAAKANRLWLIPVAGGEALPLFSEKLDVHSFAWSADGAAIYYSVTRPLTHEQEEAQKTEWKDVIRWREQHRGDLLLKQPVAEALARALAVRLRRARVQVRPPTPRQTARKARRQTAQPRSCGRGDHRKKRSKHRPDYPFAGRRQRCLRHRAGSSPHRESSRLRAVSRSRRRRRDTANDAQ